MVCSTRMMAALAGAVALLSTVHARTDRMAVGPSERDHAAPVEQRLLPAEAGRPAVADQSDRARVVASWHRSGVPAVVKLETTGAP